MSPLPPHEPLANSRGHSPGNPPNDWDSAAPTFDDEPDHGLRDAAVRQAWTELLRSHLPAARPAERRAVLDAGCGTGSLSVVLAGLGHQVTGIDLSPAMIALASAKAAAEGQAITFQVMDAAEPTFAPGSFDVVVCRHLLWALPEPAQVLRRWAALLRPRGRLLLIEGRWGTGAGLTSKAILSALPAEAGSSAVLDLSRQPELWGREVSDERYLVVVDL